MIEVKQLLRRDRGMSGSGSCSSGCSGRACTVMESGSAPPWA